MAEKRSWFDKLAERVGNSWDKENAQVKEIETFVNDPKSHTSDEQR